MLMWEAIVLIVLIGCLASVMDSYFKTRRATARRPTAEDGATADEVRQLKERIQVLERVITDNHGSARLGDEIERLRDR